MSFAANPILVPDRDSLPLKKRDQRLRLPLQQQQQQHSDDATFKAPYPYKSRSDIKMSRTGPFQPVPRRVPALYQPWTQLHTSTRSKPHVLSAFREPHSRVAEWRQFDHLHSGWDFTHHYQHSRHFTVHPHPHHPSIFSPISPVSVGLQTSGGYGWEELKTVRSRVFSTDKQSNGRNRGPYTRRRETEKVDCFSRVENPSPLSPSVSLPHSPSKDQRGTLHKSKDFLRDSAPECSFRRAPSHNFSNSTNTFVTEDTPRPAVQATSNPSSSSNLFPWLLPHFVAGSLIELRDGRLRQVEHLQTEDFLLGSLACPDLRLSCCTVQSISSSAASSSLSRLLILLHDLQSQELVDVYVEYPFFVRDQGWSSCSPQRTARLCGLRCRQLSVGDVCLALTPVSAALPPSSVTLEPETSPKEMEAGCEALKVSQPQVHSEPQGPKEERVRRRHCSAPELRHSGIHGM